MSIDGWLRARNSLRSPVRPCGHMGDDATPHCRCIEKSRCALRYSHCVRGVWCRAKRLSFRTKLLRDKKSWGLIRKTLSPLPWPHRDDFLSTSTKTNQTRRKIRWRNRKNRSSHFRVRMPTSRTRPDDSPANVPIPPKKNSAIS